MFRSSLLGKNTSRSTLFSDFINPPWLQVLTDPQLYTAQAACTTCFQIQWRSILPTDYINGFRMILKINVSRKELNFLQIFYESHASMGFKTKFCMHVTWRLRPMFKYVNIKTNKTANLPAVLSGRKTRSLALREEHILGVSEYRCLRKYWTQVRWNYWRLE
jgi:hypothetical protein